MSSIASSLGSTSLLPATAATLNGSSTSAANAASNAQQPNFMKLLMAQMQNQDPTSPTSATDYVTQMAQFSSVQGITQLNQNITTLLAMQNMTQGVSLIGKTVTYTNAAGKVQSGAVAAVSLVGGQPQLVVNNTNVTLNQIQTIQATPKNNALASLGGGN
jgi:flagellar basal-body rod modification protein FlgD